MKAQTYVGHVGFQFNHICDILGYLSGVGSWPGDICDEIDHELLVSYYVTFITFFQVKITGRQSEWKLTKLNIKKKAVGISASCGYLG